MVETSKKSSSVMVRNNNVSSESTVKFLYSYGGKILPRYPDGKLRYVGGETRVLSVDRSSISFADLLVKLEELCGSSVSLRCQLPSEDLDALVSIKSDEDLINVMEEYDLASKEKSNPLKIKVFLFPTKSINKSSPPTSATSSPIGRYSSTASSFGFGNSPINNVVPGIMAGNNRHHHQIISSTQPMGFPTVSCYEKSSNHHHQFSYCACNPSHQGSPRQVYLVHNGNHWQ